MTLTDYVQVQGAPADIGTFQLPCSVMVFQYTFSGTDYICAIRSGNRGWVLVDYGTVASTVINSAIAEGLSEVTIGDGTYSITATIDGDTGVNLLGIGNQTILSLDADVPVIHYDAKSDFSIRNLKIDGNSAERIAYHQGAIWLEDCSNASISLVWVFDMWDNGVLLQTCSDIRIHDNRIDTVDQGGTGWFGIFFYGSTDSVAINNRIVTGDFIGIGNGDDDHANQAERNILANNIISDFTDNGIDLNNTLDYIVIGNVVNTCAALFIGEASERATVVGNVCINNTTAGINLGYGGGTPRLTDSVITNNKCYNCPFGIDAYKIRYCVINDNHCLGMTTSEGINISESDDIIIEDNFIRDGLDDGGINVWQSDDVSVQGNFIRDSALGISVNSGAAETNIAICYNHITDNTVGINIGSAFIVGARVLGNLLEGNTTTIVDSGTNTRLPTLLLPFVQGTTFLSVDGAAWGWEIDADTDFAIALGHLPLELQEVVRWKVWATSLVAEADAMRAQIAGAGGASDEAYNAEAVAVVDHPSTTTNFAVNDIVYWVFDSGDDVDIDDMFGGDAIQIKVLHEGAGGEDCETDAVFLCVEIEYV